MEAFVAGGRIADVLIGLILLETLALAWRRPQRLVLAWPGLAAGLGLALALRCALTGAAWPWLAVCLSVSGLAYAVEVRRRWRP